jgi:Predicted transcriptional regulators
MQTKQSPSAVPKFLRAKRIEQGLSQAQVAERLGVTRPVVTYIETGKRKLKVADVVRLSRILCFTLKEFFQAEELDQSQSS